MADEAVQPRWWRQNFALPALICLTLGGAVLRFAYLDQPAIWGDESMTYYRTSGSYLQMLELLRNDGFPPLHYTAYWLLGKLVTLTPFWMRVIPAVAGTLMIPAMYWLGRQFAGQKTSLMVALFTACSAYLLVYSRDAKMYMHFWLFVVVHVCCLIVWMRDGGRLYWWGWACCGIAMIGTSMTGLAVLAIEPLLILSQRRAYWWRAVFYVVGLGIIAAGPAYYYTQFNKWVDRVEKNPRLTGITWVGPYNAQRGGPDLLLFTASAYLSGWEWPTAAVQKDVPPRVLAMLKLGVGALLVFAAAGLIPWKKSWMMRDTSGVEAPWRGGLWLALMLVVPVYGFYCASMPEASRPGGWAVWLLRSGWILWVSLALAATWLAMAFVHGRCGWWLLVQALLVSGVIVALLYAVGAMVPTWHYSVWMPRYLGFVWPAFAVVFCVLLMRLPLWPVRAIAIACVLGVNLYQFSARIRNSEPPLDVAVVDFAAGINIPGSTMRTFNLIADGGNGAPGTTTPGAMPMKYYLDIATNQRHEPVQLRQNVYRLFMIAPQRNMQQIGQYLSRAPDVEHVIVWGRSLRKSPELSGDILADRNIAAQWKLVKYTQYPVSDHWTWQRLSTWYRWEYVRAVAASE